jgi:hypothetical protein
MAVPPDHFVHVGLVAHFLLPITWGLLPVSAFAPQLLQPYFPAAVMTGILVLQVEMIKGYLYQSGLPDTNINSLVRIELSNFLG